jgi:hypothetical protein
MTLTVVGCLYEQIHVTISVPIELRFGKHPLLCTILNMCIVQAIVSFVCPSDLQQELNSCNIARRRSQMLLKKIKIDMSDMSFNKKVEIYMIKLPFVLA